MRRPAIPALRTAVALAAALAAATLAPGCGGAGEDEGDRAAGRPPAAADTGSEAGGAAGGPAAAGAAADTTVAELVLAARGRAAHLGASLMQALASAMDRGGPTAAIPVCSRMAPAIAERLSDDGWTVGRTALRVRNPANAPDPWERRGLEAMAAAAAAGHDLDGLERYEVVERDGVRTFRYLRAIPTAGLCLRCHGTDIAPDVRRRLAELYPDDEATGFRTGDLRGAFTLSRPLP